MISFIVFQHVILIVFSVQQTLLVNVILVFVKSDMDIVKQHQHVSVSDFVINAKSLYLYKLIEVRGKFIHVSIHSKY